MSGENEAYLWLKEGYFVREYLAARRVDFEHTACSIATVIY